MSKPVIIAAAFAAVLLAGCQTTPTEQAAAPVEDRTASGAAGAGSGASTSGAGGAGVAGSAQGSQQGSASAAAGNPLRDPSSPLSRRIILFEFDSFTVSDQYRPLVEAHGRYLAQNRNAKLTIQGHADERGSREYNIALGQKRADAVKRMMTLLGAQDVQIETVSFGEEKPKNSGHDEASWAENRRDELVYAGE